MKISDAGLQLIKDQEGYLAKQPDGSCRAYRCPAGVWTAGWGCTEGVTPNTQWTEAEATEALRTEMRKHEANVERLVKVALTQGQFDALVSLCYNIGAGNLGKSTLLKHLNAGDYARAASHFADFKYARVQGSTAKLYKVEPGTPVALPGLVARRAAEMALFLESAPVEMPQKIEPAKAKVEWSTVAWKILPLAGAGGAGVSQAAPYVPAVPSNFTETVTNLQSWKAFAIQVAALPKELVGAGAAALTCMAVLLLFHKMTSKPNA